MGETPVFVEPSSVEPPLMPPSRPKRGWIGWTLILLLLIGVGVWWVRKTTDAPTATAPAALNAAATSGTATPATAPTNTSSIAAGSAVSTAGWKTYSNSVEGFTIKRPQDWVVDHSKQESETVTFTSPDTVKAIDAQVSVTTGLNYGPLSDDIAISYYDKVSDFAAPNVPALKDQNITLDALMAKYATELTMSNIAATTLGGGAAKEVILGGESAYYTVFAEHNGHLYEIFFNNVDTKDKLTATEQQILKTFTFMPAAAQTTTLTQ